MFVFFIFYVTHYKTEAVMSNIESDMCTKCIMTQLEYAMNFFNVAHRENLSHRFKAVKKN